MQKTTTIVLIAALALVAAALVGVTFAQTSTPNLTQTVAPWSINPNTAASYCHNGTGVAPYCNNGSCINGNCVNNGIVCAAGNCYNTGVGYCAGPQTQGANQACSQYGYGNQQEANAYQGGRMGNCGRGW